MTHEYTWDNTDPISSQKAGLGAQKIAETREMAFERLAVDHNMDGVLTAASDQDGTHKLVTLKMLAADPQSLAGAGIVYTKTSNSIVELFYIDGAGNVTQLTTDGVLPFTQSPVYVKYQNSARRVIGGTYTTINFNEEVDNVNGTFASGVLTVVSDGFYSVFIHFANSSTYGTLRLRKTSLGVTTTLFQWPALGGAGVNFSHVLWAYHDDLIFVDAINTTVNTDSYIEIIKI